MKILDPKTIRKGQVVRANSKKDAPLAYRIITTHVGADPTYGLTLYGYYEVLRYSKLGGGGKGYGRPSVKSRHGLFPISEFNFGRSRLV